MICTESCCGFIGRQSRTILCSPSFYASFFAAVHAPTQILVRAGTASWQKQLDGASHHHFRYLKDWKRYFGQFSQPPDSLDSSTPASFHKVLSVLQTHSDVPSCVLQVRFFFRLRFPHRFCRGTRVIGRSGVFLYAEQPFVVWGLRGTRTRPCRQNLDLRLCRSGAYTAPCLTRRIGG